MTLASRSHSFFQRDNNGRCQVAPWVAHVAKSWITQSQGSSVWGPSHKTLCNCHPTVSAGNQKASHRNCARSATWFPIRHQAMGQKRRELVQEWLLVPQQLHQWNRVLRHGLVRRELVEVEWNVQLIEAREWNHPACGAFHGVNKYRTQCWTTRGTVPGVEVHVGWEHDGQQRRAHKPLRVVSKRVVLLGVSVSAPGRWERAFFPIVRGRPL